MSHRLPALAACLCFAATLQAQAPKPVSGFYGENTLQLVVAADGSFTGSFYDETGAGKFSCGFLIKSLSSRPKGGTYQIRSWWPAKELGEPVGDEVVNGTLSVFPDSVTLQLPKNAHGGCWNVNSELNNGEPVDLNRDTSKPAWKELRVVKSKRLSLRKAPKLATPTRPYVVQGDVVAVIEKQGPWLHVDYYAYMDGQSYSGWVQDLDLLPLP